VREKEVPSIRCRETSSRKRPHVAERKRTHSRAEGIYYVGGKVSSLLPKKMRKELRGKEFADEKDLSTYSGEGRRGKSLLDLVRERARPGKTRPTTEEKDDSIKKDHFKGH